MQFTRFPKFTLEQTYEQAVHPQEDLALGVLLCWCCRLGCRLVYCLEIDCAIFAPNSIIELASSGNLTSNVDGILSRPRRKQGTRNFIGKPQETASMYKKAVCTGSYHDRALRFLRHKAWRTKSTSLTWDLRKMSTLQNLSPASRDGTEVRSSTLLLWA